MLLESPATPIKGEFRTGWGRFSVSCAIYDSVRTHLRQGKLTKKWAKMWKESTQCAKTKNSRKKPPPLVPAITPISPSTPDTVNSTHTQNANRGQQKSQWPQIISLDFANHIQTFCTINAEMWHTRRNIMHWCVYSEWRWLERPRPSTETHAQTVHLIRKLLMLGSAGS